MRRARLIGVIAGTAAVVGISVVAAPVILGQARVAGQGVPDERNWALTVQPKLQLLTGGGPQIGVTVRDLDKGEGVAVDEVRTGSPAAKAGVKAGDTIVEFDGEKIRSVRQLTRLVQETPGGRVGYPAHHVWLFYSAIRVDPLDRRQRTPSRRKKRTS